MKTMIIYDQEGTIISQYSATDVKAPVGIPYIILEDYEMSYEDDTYRRIERVDTSVEPHQVVFGLTRKEQELTRMTLDEYKALRQKENKTALATFLEDHPLQWQDGMYYGITQEDQNEMIADKTAYDFKRTIGDTNWPLQWHSIHSDCRDFTEEEFAALLNAIIDFVYPYRQLEMTYKDAIYSATTKEEVSAVNIVYAVPDDNDEEDNQEPPVEDTDGVETDDGSGDDSTVEGSEEIDGDVAGITEEEESGDVAEDDQMPV